jgi:hypothetical protein
MAVKNACSNHPNRVAAGICRHCSTSVCNECITKIEGINVCAKCLARTLKADQSKRVAEKRQGVAARGGMMILSYVGLSIVLFFYGLLLVLLT